MNGVLTELIVIDAFTAGKVVTLEPCQCVEDGDYDQPGKQQEPGKGEEVDDTHELWDGQDTPSHTPPW